MLEITHVSVSLAPVNDERLLAFASFTFDDGFAVHSLKIIGGEKGPFVAMPSRKLTDRCCYCHCSNHLKARFCNGCGARLPHNRAKLDESGREKLHADVAHPIIALYRQLIEAVVLDEYYKETRRSCYQNQATDYQKDYGLQIARH